jgi:hypothetical protein
MKNKLSSQSETRQSEQQQQLLKELRQSLEDVRKTKVEYSREDMRTAIAYNREASTFYEKICLINGATLAVSLTLLGAVLQYSPGHHLPHKAFLSFVVPAWSLLLLSTHFCALRIVGSHNMNGKLIEQSGSEANEYHLASLKDITQRMSNLNLEELKSRLEKRVADIDGYISRQNSVMESKTKEAKKHYTDTIAISRLAFGFTIFGIVLLCCFAVRVLIGL